MPKFGEQVEKGLEPESTETGNPSENNEGNENNNESNNGEYAGVEKFLADFGYVDGVVPFEETVEEDGKEVVKTIGRKFDELDDSEKYDVLKTLTDSTTEGKFELSEEESKLITTLREKEVSFEDMMNAEIEREVSKVTDYYESKSEDYDKMPDDILYKKYLSEKYTEESEDEINERYTIEKDIEGHDKKVAIVRDSFKDKQALKLKKIADDIAKENETQIDKDRKIITDKVVLLDKVAGWRVSDEDKNAILEGLLEIDDNGNSKFVNEILGDPERMFEAAYLYKFGNHLFNKQEATHRKNLNLAVAEAKKAALGVNGEEGRREGFSKNSSREEQQPSGKEKPRVFGEQ